MIARQRRVSLSLLSARKILPFHLVFNLELVEGLNVLLFVQQQAQLACLVAIELSENETAEKK